MRVTLQKIATLEGGGTQLVFTTTDPVTDLTTGAEFDMTLGPVVEEPPDDPGEPGDTVTKSDLAAAVSSLRSEISSAASAAVAQAKSETLSIIVQKLSAQ